MRTWKRLLIPTLLCAVLFAPLMAPIQAHEPQPPPMADIPAAYVPGQLLVKFRPEASAAAKGSRLAALGLSTLQEMGDLSISLLAVPAGQEQAMIARLRQDPLVEFAEPNYRVEIPQVVPSALPVLTQLAVSSTVTCTQIYTPVIPNDWYYSSQWNLPKICLPEAWSATTGATDVVIAIISSGIDVNHPDLQSKIWTNPGENPCNGLDDDGNGFVDDVHGWNFVDDNNDVTDDIGIGTYVAGVAAAATNNAIGIAGVSWGAKILPIRVYGLTHASIAEVILGLNYAANLRQRWQMPMVVLLLGDLGGDHPDPFYQAAVYDAHTKGCLLVANSGDTNEPCNENCTCPVNWLAAATYVIGVSSTDENDEWVPSSKCGFYIDFCAPGKDVLFTIPGGNYSVGRSSILAAAHVAGLASIIWSVNPTYQHDLVEILMRWTAVDLGVPGWDMYFGYGCIDAARAILEAGHYLQVLPNDHRLIFVYDPAVNPPSHTIINPGTSSPTWRAETDAPWLTISQLEQHTPSTITVSLNPSALWQLGYGVYTAPITVSSTMSNSQNNPQTFMVTAAYTDQIKTLELLPLFYRYVNPADCGP